ncbi:MAG TPA: flippase-like domain-containing protein [Candidatus Alectryocaccobium stercorigallinarum]|nr:flippase-like domain-containing protein [Candidatus Alectryocaccobium stercorigallinarum]
MKISRTKLASLILLLALIILTLIALLNGHDLDDLLKAMENADASYLILAVACIVAFLFGQGFIFRYLFAVLGQNTDLIKCAGYSFKGYFFCSVTPFAIGGPPAQIVYMKKDNIPVPVASMVVFIVATFYKFVLVILGAVLIIFGQGFLAKYVGSAIVWFGVGMFLTCGFCFILFMFMFHPRLAKKAIFKFFRWLERHHLMKHKYGREENIEAGMSKYTQTADFLRNHPASMSVLLLLTAIQRFCLFAVTYCVYRALGFHDESVFTVVVLQATISICVDMLPIPGGMGISEALFTMLFAHIFTSTALLPALALSRGISYYAELIICAAVIFVTQYAFKGRRQRIHAEQT